MPELKLLFLQMVVILAAVQLASAVFRRIRQPGVVGEMAAGLLLGPSLLGQIAPSVLNGLFPAASLGPLYALSQVGLVLFIFQVGLETQPGVLRGSAKSVVLTSQASILAPFVGGGVLAWVFYPRLGEGVARLPFVLFVGTAMALGIYIFVMVLWIRPAMRRVFPSGEPLGLGRFAVAMIFLLSSVWITEALAVHALFGAFLAGIVMPKGGDLQPDLHQRLESVTLVLLLPLFFVYTGLRTSVRLMNSGELWLWCSLIVLVAVVTKLLVSAVCARAGGLGWREALALGALVNTRGLVELVILNVGLDLHILSPALFSMMVIMALLTTVMTAPLIDSIRPSWD